MSRGHSDQSGVLARRSRCGSKSCKKGNGHRDDVREGGEFPGEREDGGM